MLPQLSLISRIHIVTEPEVLVFCCVIDNRSRIMSNINIKEWIISDFVLQYESFIYIKS